MSDIAEQLRAEIELTVELDILHHDAANELDRLRAEVASLKEEEQISEFARNRMELILNRFVQLLHGGEPTNGLHDWHTLPDIAEQRINDLTQQLAAANAELTKWRDEIASLKESVEYWKKDSAAAWDKCEERRLESIDLTQQLAAANSELEKWRNWNPDDENMRMLQEQAKDSSLAAKNVYIRALEHKLATANGRVEKLADAAKGLRQYLALFCGPDDAIANEIFSITDAAQEQK